MTAAFNKQLFGEPVFTGQRKSTIQETPSHLMVSTVPYVSCLARTYTGLPFVKCHTSVRDLLIKRPPGHNFAYLLSRVSRFWQWNHGLTLTTWFLTHFNSNKTYENKCYGFINKSVKNISVCISCVWPNVSHMNTNTK